MPRAQRPFLDSRGLPRQVQRNLAAAVGDLLRDYRLEGVLGKGGMATVFLGVHQLLGRKAAIKILADDLVNDESYVRRFLGEARVVNEIHHPNVVDIYDFVVTDQPRLVALVMELIDGVTLDKQLKKGPLSLADTLDVCEQLVRALKTVHGRGVVHRDLKPENLMISRRDGDIFIKILDFGIAKVPEGNQTQSGLVFGTPFYMAPEQASGGQATPASDLYAVGEILFECLSGRRLFRGEPLAILRAKVFDGPPEVTFQGEGSEILANLVTRCITTTPEERPNHEEILAELEHLRGALGLWPTRTPGGSRIPLERDRKESLPGIAVPGGIELATETLKGKGPSLAPKHYAVLGLGVALGLGAAFLVRGRNDVTAEAIVVPAPQEPARATVTPVEPAKAEVPPTVPPPAQAQTATSAKVAAPTSPVPPKTAPKLPAQSPVPAAEPTPETDPSGKMIPKRERMTWDEE